MSLARSPPRLPSPPPSAEIQFGPKSPPVTASATNPQAQKMEQSVIEANSRRRIHPGTRAADIAAGPPLVPLHELDSAFQLQEHLAALHEYHTDSSNQPLNRKTAEDLATPPAGIDRTLWLYELCRFLIGRCNSLIVGFLFDTPPCSAVTCPEMRASEWQFLCAVHDQPKGCCAIDYCCHTLDWAANVVTNPNIFPSRFVALADSHDKVTAIKNLTNVFRRLHRIFAHAWFQHRGIFWSVEGQTGLYVFFKTVCDSYDLLPSENYKLPPEAEGLETATSGESDERKHLPPVAPIAIVKPHRRDEEDSHVQLGRNNTRRHIRRNPSVGSAVSTVLEQDEDDGAAAEADARRQTRVSAPSSVAEENEDAEIPLMVEQDSHDVLPSAISTANEGLEDTLCLMKPAVPDIALTNTATTTRSPRIHAAPPLDDPTSVAASIALPMEDDLDGSDEPVLAADALHSDNIGLPPASSLTSTHSPLVTSPAANEDKSTDRTKAIEEDEQVEDKVQENSNDKNQGNSAKSQVVTMTHDDSLQRSGPSQANDPTTTGEGSSSSQGGLAPANPSNKAHNFVVAPTSATASTEPRSSSPHSPPQAGRVAEDDTQEGATGEEDTGATEPEIDIMTEREHNSNGNRGGELAPQGPQDQDAGQEQKGEEEREQHSLHDASANSTED